MPRGYHLKTPQAVLNMELIKRRCDWMVVVVWLIYWLYLIQWLSADKRKPVIPLSLHFPHMIPPLNVWWWDFNCIITYHRLVFTPFMSCLYHLNAIIWIRSHFLAVFPALNLPMAHKENRFCCYYRLEKAGTAKQVKGDRFCLFIFLFFSMWYTYGFCAFKRSWRLESPKSALTGAPLSHRKHCSWNSPVSSATFNSITSWHHTSSPCRTFA